MDANVNRQVSKVKHHTNRDVVYVVSKQVIDYVGSFILFVLLAPVLLFFSMLIPLESAGSPFYLQERLGKDGRVFKIIKLRSMCSNAEQGGPCWAEVDDPRVTKVGRFIRKTRIDEIPQLINVLKGEMSLIGPRPEREYFYKEFERSLPGFAKRIVVKPGITGWAQVNGGYDLTPKKKLDLDVFYIKHRSVLLEVKILLRTLSIVFTGSGAR